MAEHPDASEPCGLSSGSRDFEGGPHPTAGVHLQAAEASLWGRLGPFLCFLFLEKEFGSAWATG